MTSPVKVLLLTSLGANAALALNLWLPRSSSVEPSPAAMQIVARSRKSAAHTAPASTPLPAAIDTDRALILEAAARYGRMPALGDPRALAERMYRDGYPPDVVTSVVAPVFGEWLGDETMKKAAREGSATVKQFRQAILKADGPMQRYMQDLFPHGHFAPDKTRERELRFGPLPLEKILAIERLEEALEWGINRGAPSVQRDAPIEAKMNEALSQFLSPAELEDYWRFNSVIARSLQHLIRTITIDEATYHRLLAAATAHHTIRGRGFFNDFDLQHLRGHLSDADLTQLISSSGRNDEAAVDKIYVSAGLSEAQRVELYVQSANILRGVRTSSSSKAAEAALAQIRATLAAAPDAAARFEASRLASELQRIAEKR